MEIDPELREILSDLSSQLTDLRQIGRRLVRAQSKRNKLIEQVEQHIADIQRDANNDWWQNGEAPPWQT